MDEVETVAADTTSEQSSSATQGTSQSTVQSHPHSYTHTHQALSNENYSQSDEPCLKRPRLQDYGHGSDTGLSETGIHHYKGRSIPVGIAQPFLKHSGNLETTPLLSKSEREDEVQLDEKQQSSQVSGEDSQVLDLFSEPLKLPQVVALKETPEASESEESQDLDRFDRFANENVTNPFQSPDGLNYGSVCKETMEERNDEIEESRTWDNEHNTCETVESNWLEKAVRPREQGHPLVKKSSSTSLPPSQGAPYVLGWSRPFHFTKVTKEKPLTCRRFNNLP